MTTPDRNNVQQLETIAGNTIGERIESPHVSDKKPRHGNPALAPEEGWGKDDEIYGSDELRVITLPELLDEMTRSRCEALAPNRDPEMPGTYRRCRLAAISTRAGWDLCLMHRKSKTIVIPR